MASLQDLQSDNESTCSNQAETCPRQFSPGPEERQSFFDGDSTSASGAFEEIILLDPLLDLPVSISESEKLMLMSGSQNIRPIAWADRNKRDNIESLHINDLPLEIKLYIFTFFSHFQLTRSLCLVCKHWKQLAYDPQLWLDIDLTYDSILPIDSIKKFSQLRRLKIFHQQDAIFEPRDMISICKHFPLLEELEIPFCASLGASHILEMAAGLPNIHHLNMEGCNGVDLLCVLALAGLPHLTSLNLSHCGLMGTDEELITIADSLKNLKYLNLDGLSHMTDRGISHIIEKHHSTLESFLIDCELISDGTLQKLSLCRKLTEFAISFGSLLTDGALEPFKSLPQLKKLKLRKAEEISSSAYCELFEHLTPLTEGFNSGHQHMNPMNDVGMTFSRTLSSLSELDLSECTKLQDDSVQAIVNCCGKTLKVLRLNWCWHITDKGLEVIVSKCSNLQLLALVGLDKIIGHCLVEIPVKIPKLTLLDLQQCNKINDEVVKLLVEIMPKLTAIDYYGESFNLPDR